MSGKRLALAVFLVFLITFKALAAESTGLQFFLKGKPSTVKDLYIMKGESMLPATRDDLPGEIAGTIDGAFDHIYLPLESPGATKLFQALGAIYSWSSSKELLFIFSSGRNIYFDTSSSWNNYRGREQRLAKGFIRQDENTFIPLGTLFRLMNIGLAKGAEKNSFTITPVLDDLLWKEDMGAREFLIHSTCPLKYNVELSNNEYITIFFPEVRSTLEPGEYWIVDAKVKVEDVETAEQKGRRITIFYPQFWEGQLTQARLSGDIVIEMLPRFPLTSGYSYETLTKMAEKAAGGVTTLTLEATGPIQYLWNFNPENRLLIIDIPLMGIPQDFSRPKLSNSLAKEFNAFSFDKLYGNTRLYFTLAADAHFTFATNSKDNRTLNIVFEKGDISEFSGSGVTGDPEHWGIIVLDPGHGGCDPGAVNRTSGLTEKEVNLDVAKRLARILRQNRWKVVLTRTSDRDVSWAYSPDRVELQARVDVARANGAIIFISIHCNASTNSAERGSSLHWCHERDLPLAYALTEATSYFQAYLGIPQRGLHQNTFYVIRHTSMPSLLVEMAHISNYEEALIFADPDCRQKLAEGIARGIEKYFLEQGYKKKSP